VKTIRWRECDCDGLPCINFQPRNRLALSRACKGSRPLKAWIPTIEENERGRSRGGLIDILRSISCVTLSTGPDLMQPPSESTVEAGSDARAASHWTWDHSLATWRTAHLLHDSPETLWAYFVTAAPRSMSANTGSPKVDASRSSRRRGGG
jgi:hypothetical protein